jgi:hypothetical protein
MVSTGAVELRCVATALWSLQRSGQLRIIDKAPMTGKASYRQRRKQNDLLLPEIPCKLKFERIGDPTDQVGLEYLLLAALPERGRVLAKEFITPWDLGRPLVAVDALLVPVQEEAVAAGVISLVEPARRKRHKSLKWSIHSQYAVREERRPEIESQYNFAKDNGFFDRDADPSLSTLQGECSMAIRAFRPDIPFTQAAG